jgi:hypothetical protein
MTPSERLILFAGAALIGGAIAAAAIYLTPWVAIGAILGGLVLTTLTTVETTPAEPGYDATTESRGLRPVARQDTERRARAARDE